MSKKVLDQKQIAAMMAEYDRRGTCTCPLCGKESQPWNGMWLCECGAMAVRS